jgi:hypothetical protein
MPRNQRFSEWPSACQPNSMTFRYRALLRIVRLAALAAAAIGVAALLPPGSSGAEAVQASQDACRNGALAGRDRFEHCEVRGYEFAPPSRAWAADAGLNGGISAAGEERSTVRVETLVRSWARTIAQARSVGGAVAIHLPTTNGGARVASR